MPRRTASLLAATAASLALLAGASLALLVGGSLALPGGAASAQTDRPVTAVISALSMAPLPAATTVEVVTYDDSELARIVGDVAQRTLGDGGFQVGAGGQLLLGLELIDQLSLNDDRDPTVGATPPIRRPDDANERVNIFADSEDSVLGGRIGATLPNAVQFGIYATLNDRASGRRVWQAEIMADIAGSTREAVGPQMARVLAQRLGEAIDREELVLE